MDGGNGRPEGQKNVLGQALVSCSHDPVTGFFAMAAVILDRRIRGCIQSAPS